MKHALQISILLLLLQSCGGSYMPSQFVIPAFDSAGQIQMSAAGYSMNPTSLQATYALTDRQYVGAVVSAYPYNHTSQTWMKHVEGELITAWYKNLELNEIERIFLPTYIEAGVALGYGNIFDARWEKVNLNWMDVGGVDREYERFRGDHIKISAHTGFASRRGWLEAGLSLRGTYVHQLSAWSQRERYYEYDSTMYVVSESSEPRDFSGFVLEMNGNVRVGGEKVFGMLNYGLAYASNVWAVPVFIGMGLFVRM